MCLIRETFRSQFYLDGKESEKVHVVVLAGTEFQCETFSFQEWKERVFTFVASEETDIADGVTLVMWESVVQDPSVLDTIGILDRRNFLNDAQILTVVR